MEITELAADGTLQNFAVLDVASMAWGHPAAGCWAGRFWSSFHEASGLTVFRAAMNARSAAG